MNQPIKATVLLSAYACCPGKPGSEPRYGWNYLLQYAQTFEKIILVTSSMDYKVVEDKLAELGITHVKVIVVKMKFTLDRLHNVPVGGIHLHYYLWLRKALAIIQALPDKIDFAHHVTYGSLQFGTPLYKLNCPFIFGPVGGGQVTNEIFYPLMGKKARYIEKVRNLTSWLFYRFNPFFKGTMRNASIIYCGNEETSREARRFVPPDQQGKIKMLLDVTLDTRFMSLSSTPVQRQGGLSVLWVGRLIPRKGIEILLNVARLLREDDFTLTMVGDGPMRDKTLAYIKEYGLEKTVKFAGQVQQQQILDYYRAADLLLFLSYRDSAGLQIVEAFSQGLPVLAFDQFGASLLIDGDRGFKIPVEGSLEDIQQRIADTIRAQIAHPEKLKIMGRNAIPYARGFNWDHKMTTILQDIKSLHIYEENVDLRPERV